MGRGSGASRTTLVRRLGGVGPVVAASDALDATAASWVVLASVADAARPSGACGRSRDRAGSNVRSCGPHHCRSAGARGRRQLPCLGLRLQGKRGGLTTLSAAAVVPTAAPTPTLASVPCLRSYLGSMQDRMSHPPPNPLCVFWLIACASAWPAACCAPLDQQGSAGSTRTALWRLAGSTAWLAPSAVAGDSPTDSRLQNTRRSRLSELRHPCNASRHAPPSFMHVCRKRLRFLLLTCHLYAAMVAPTSAMTRGAMAKRGDSTTSRQLRWGRGLSSSGAGTGPS